MGKVAILTDSNSGSTQAQSKELGVKVIPMPFFIDGEQYFEDINLTQEEFYEKLQQDADISTSQPSIGEIQDAFDELLKEYDELVDSLFLMRRSLLREVSLRQRLRRFLRSIRWNQAYILHLILLST